MGRHDVRAIVPFYLTRQIFSNRWTGKRLRRRWFKKPHQTPKTAKPRRPKPPPLRPWELWTEADDHIVRIFAPQEAAAMLGRTVHAVYKRRSRLTIGKPHRDRKRRKVVRREDYAE